MGKVGASATEEKRNVEEWQPTKQPETQELKRRAPSPVEATPYEPPGITYI